MYLIYRHPPTHTHTAAADRDTHIKNTDMHETLLPQKLRVLVQKFLTLRHTASFEQV